MTNSGIDHETTEAVRLASEWLAATPRDRIRRAIVPTLQSQFGLTAAQAIEAIREANLRHARAA